MSYRPKLVRITTVPISMRLLITGQPAYMKDAGFDVTLVSSEGNDWNGIPDLSQYSLHKIEMARQIDIKKDIRALFALIRLFRKIRPDIVHSHTPKAGLLAMLAAKISGVPVRIHTLAGLPLMTATGVKRKILFQAEKLTFKSANETWPNSKQLLNFVLTNKMLPQHKVRMILNGSSNGIDLSKFTVQAINSERQKALRKDYTIVDSDFCFLAVGRMVNDKGIAELVQAFLQVYATHSGARLFLLGPFEEADGLPQSLIDIIKTHQAITHINWSDEVEYFMSICQCFVHASHREGFPGVVLQAGAMGIPIICSDIPGNIDIVESESEGHVYPVKNEQALLVQMTTVLDNYALAIQKAQLLQEKIIKNYDRKIVHKAIRDMYVQLLNEKQVAHSLRTD